eukprot:4187669-Pyramimonas_sp.AAC.1
MGRRTRGYTLTTNLRLHSYRPRVYSHDGPVGRRTRGYILTADQSDAGHTGIFSRRTNRTQHTRVYSRDGPRTNASRLAGSLSASLRTCAKGLSASSLLLHWCVLSAQVVSSPRPSLAAECSCRLLARIRFEQYSHATGRFGQSRACEGCDWSVVRIYPRVLRPIGPS